MIAFEWEWMLRILCAALIGAVIGYERHNRSKEAGLRTHMIVAAAAALLMVVSKYGFSDVGASDPARIAAQVVSGIGFLGVGIIFIKNETVLGLTTAAGIWATSAVGLAFGAGFYVLGVLTGFLIVVIQIIVRVIFDYSMPRTTFHFMIEINQDESNHAPRQITDKLKRLGVVHTDNRISAGKDDRHYTLVCDGVSNKEVDPTEIVATLKGISGVESVKII